eukprot:CAMPEP_0180165254 /NCGR_PEP_ID=MMETSP0986-20121125/30865_1 /TAXON_ID=697907 /ORGANISM="non described non described, Strain CCMP2293" /LENGTH=220 /DNA_ID=CAMNT_0022116205 /DNA_START=64 /DNA_END=723 /DNA_ORIENTATION=+
MAVDDLPRLVRVNPQDDGLARAPAQHARHLLHRLPRNRLPANRHDHVALQARSLPLADAVFFDPRHAEGPRSMLNAVVGEFFRLHSEMNASVDLLLARSVPGGEEERALGCASDLPVTIPAESTSRRACSRCLVARSSVWPCIRAAPAPAPAMCTRLQLLVRRVLVAVTKEDLGAAQDEEDDRQHRPQNYHQGLNRVLPCRVERLGRPHKQDGGRADHEG